ncbi:hypothetical protein ACFW1A_14525 [Kitasatospora sp. NPDC058965]|uniref:effector-associated constant component EACC1 n=1 Tax=Kitasatospora sp. NPDC058965 TaxID=3346682 RepID=UPI00367E27E7
MQVEARVAVSGRDEVEEFAALWDWLQDEPQLRGGLTRAEAPIGPTELGSGLAAVTVALGSGGVGVALAKALVTWLRTRRADVTLTVSVDNRTAHFQARNVDAAHVQQALEVLQSLVTGDDDE